MSTTPSEGPKTFISYSWSAPDHEKWVINLATQLVESGVDVVLDKWDLREGADKYAFMEKMVTDPSVRKVVVVCDRIYAEKADGRQGGVGTETQIISQEIYSQVDPTDREQKFVAVITEKDEKGQPYVPTFLKSRIYIDMSESNGNTNAFEQLLRWIYDQPLYKKPEKGKPPAYLFAETAVSLGTTARFQRAVDALKQQKTGALGALTDYFDTFAGKFETFGIKPDPAKQFDDQVVENIDSFLPYRNEAVEVFLAVAKYHASLEGYEAVHRFLEKLLPYGFWPAGLSTWTQWNADNFRFIIHELFLYAIATMLKYERFEGVREFIEQDYFFPAGSPDVESGMVPFTLFRHYLESLEHRNSRLNLRRLSLAADLLEKQANLTDIRFDDIMQADFVLFLHADLIPVDKKTSRGRWWPDTLLYAERLRSPFEIFARGQSSRYFAKLKTALGVGNKSELEELVGRYSKQELKVPKWEFESFDPARLMGIDRLDSRP
jgi:hypothetical protein